MTHNPSNENLMMDDHIIRHASNVYLGQSNIGLKSTKMMNFQLFRNEFMCYILLSESKDIKIAGSIKRFNVYIKIGAYCFINLEELNANLIL